MSSDKSKNGKVTPVLITIIVIAIALAVTIAIYEWNIHRSVVKTPPLTLIIHRLISKSLVIMILLSLLRTMGLT
ncbi:hypothetical protein [Vulcanisaeta distributa]|uniref:hypothetical protein n=1 Tax=Vulcanisaeta distributa TaxID=164451 RepID=UPI0006D01E9B|nr:hypothetical protein [Vulcanisaeta distributa]